MFLRRVVLFATALTLAWHFEFLMGQLDQIGVFLRTQPGHVRLVMAGLGIFLGVASIGDGFRRPKWYHGVPEIVFGVCVFFVGLQYARTVM